jgi:hypothetical protein
MSQFLLRMSQFFADNVSVYARRFRSMTLIWADFAENVSVFAVIVSVFTENVSVFC